MHVAVSTRSSIKRGAEARRRTGRWWTASVIASAGGGLDEWSARRRLAPLRRLLAVTWTLERDRQATTRPARGSTRQDDMASSVLSFSRPLARADCDWHCFWAAAACLHGVTEAVSLAVSKHGAVPQADTQTPRHTPKKYGLGRREHLYWARVMVPARLGAPGQSRAPFGKEPVAFPSHKRPLLLSLPPSLEPLRRRPARQKTASSCAPAVQIAVGNDG
ncbi:hypothetical protein IQ07DRAFT_656950 [Pyrenochaeta sp. DS3sAY3a]|nr:hypothetical protein IQ07DRAFT_656950 [Pyrenochaeta sp. DS3sAY3a]